MGSRSLDQPPGAFIAVVDAVDPAEGGRVMRIARDVLARKAGVDFRGWAEAGAFIDRILADADISNADLKGLLNRCVGPAWSVPFDFGADAKAARRYLEVLRQAIAQDLE